MENEAADRRAHGIYRAYAARLAARGFVVVVPSMPNSTGGEPFNNLLSDTRHETLPDIDFAARTGWWRKR